jgi:hypothetical protein
MRCGGDVSVRASEGAGCNTAGDEMPWAECRVLSAKCRGPSAECRVSGAEGRMSRAEGQVPSAETPSAEMTKAVGRVPRCRR